MAPHNQALSSATNLIERLGPDETNAEEIGARITSLRHDKGLSLSELASVATVSKSYLSTVEKGSGSRPGAAFLHKIAQALGVTLADLVGRELVADSPSIPTALQDLASERNLPARDVEMLAGIAFRGEAPKTRERWEFIYNAIKSSAAMDSDVK
jgi:transcriptional regulator with XRE-family HTH domain